MAGWLLRISVPTMSSTGSSSVNKLQAPIQLSQNEHLSAADLTRVHFWSDTSPLGSEPLAEMVAARTAMLDELVYTFLGGIGFTFGHMWQVRQPDEPVGQRVFGQVGRIRVPQDWRHFECSANAFAEVQGEVDPHNASHTVLDELCAGDGDEAWLLYDYGDDNTFRMKFSHWSDQEPIPAVCRRGAIGVLMRPKRAWVLQATKIQQYR
jgi:hypothetical protein